MFDLQLANNLISALNPLAAQATDLVESLAGSLGGGAQRDRSKPSDFDAILTHTSSKEEAALKRSPKPKLTPETDEPPAAAIEPSGEPHQPPAPSNDNQFATASSQAVSQPAGEPDIDAAAQDIELVLQRIQSMLDAGGQDLPEELKAIMHLFQQMMAVMMQLMQSVAQGQGQAAVTPELLARIEPLMAQLQQLQLQLNQAVTALTEQYGHLLPQAGQTQAEAGEAIADTPDAPENALSSLSPRGTSPVILNTAEDTLSEQGSAFVALLGKITLMQRRLEQLNVQLAERLQPQTTTPVLTETPDAASLELEAALPQVTNDNSVAVQTKQNTGTPTQGQGQTQTSAQTPTAALQQPSGGSTSSQQGGQQFTSSNQPNITPIGGAQAAGSGTLTKEAAPFDRVLQQQMRGSVSEQVAFQMKMAMNNGNSRIIVKLDPPELGELEIKLQVGRDGKTGMVINVERAQTLDLLQRDARALQQALADAGLKTDAGSLSFNLRGEQHSQQQQHHPAPIYYPPIDDSFDEDMLQVTSQTYTAEVQHGVNIKI